MDIRIEETDHSVAETIETQLLASLNKAFVQSDNTSFVLSAASGDNPLVGGLTANTSYGWVLIEAIWVDEDFRNQGIGQLLMEEAERKARNLGCHAAWLETSNPGAKRLYESMGYAVFGKLSNQPGHFPESHQRWFLKKLLD